MEKYIAIDNVCAWPNIKQLPNGEIVAVIFDQPCHLLWEGTIACWVSGDQGRSWEFRSNPVVNEPGTNRGNVAVGVTRRGDTVVLCSGWDKAQPAPGPFVQGNVNDDRITYRQADKSVLNLVTTVSGDACRSWECRETRFEGTDFAGWIPYGDIVQLDGERLGCAMYAAKRTAAAGETGREYGLHFFECADNGWTWRHVSEIAAGRNETAIVKLPNGSLLAAVRSSNLDLFASSDDGRTWDYVSYLTGRGMYPGGFALMNDGWLLLTYGIRNNGLYGIGATRMNLDTERWETPMIMTTFGDRAWDGGYPSNVVLEDGRILTAYYSGPNEYHHRYHMGTVLWDYEQLGRRRNQCRG